MEPVNPILYALEEIAPESLEFAVIGVLVLGAADLLAAVLGQLICGRTQQVGSATDFTLFTFLVGQMAFIVFIKGLKRYSESKYKHSGITYTWVDDETPLKSN